MDYHEKQHWAGCLKIFNTVVLEHLEGKIQDDPTKSDRGTLVFVYFGMRLLNCHIGPHAGVDATDRDQAVVDASFCCAFVLYWRWRIVHGLKKAGFTLKKHFLTRETFLDILTLTQTRILLVVLYRDWHPE